MHVRACKINKATKASSPHGVKNAINAHVVRLTNLCRPDELVIIGVTSRITVRGDTGAYICHVTVNITLAPNSSVTRDTHSTLTRTQYANEDTHAGTCKLICIQVS